MLKERIGEWRSYVLRRQAIDAKDVDELEDHLRTQAADLREAGLDEEEAKQSVIENMAPVLTMLFTPLFTLLLLAFLGTMVWMGSGINVGDRLPIWRPPRLGCIVYVFDEHLPFACRDRDRHEVDVCRSPFRPRHGVAHRDPGPIG